MLYRYAEGRGTAARFNFIIDLDFLSPTELICVDKNNHCLRHVDFALSPSETSTFAGSCTTFGNADGHRLNSALFRIPTSAEVNSNNSTMFVIGHFQILHMIDLRTDTVTTLATFDSSCTDMKLLGDSLLYLPQKLRIIVFNLDTREERVVAGGESSGSAIGTFEHTMFNNAYALLKWRDGIKILLLVTDRFNNRFAGFAYDVR